MINRLCKVLNKNQKGFTLIELMTVLVILGIILGIGLPRYLQVQAKAEWESDVMTIRNFAKAAETYASSASSYNDVTIDDLIGAELIDGTIVLNRVKAKETNVSLKNKGENDAKDVETAHKLEPFEFDSSTGRVNNLAKIIQAMIGNPPYGDGPVFEQDSDTNSVDWSKDSE